jgi:GDPmannose 4,6-dehydratase
MQNILSNITITVNPKLFVKNPETSDLGKKIINSGILIKNNKKNFLKLKSTKLIRDFGYAKDYVRAIYLIMKLKKAEDFIIASGVSRSVFDYAKEVFKIMKIPVTKIKDQNLLASDIKKTSRADNKKIKKKTKWKPEYSFKKMIFDFIKEENLNRSN